VLHTQHSPLVVYTMVYIPSIVSLVVYTLRCVPSIASLCMYLRCVPSIASLCVYNQGSCWEERPPWVYMRGRDHAGKRALPGCVRGREHAGKRASLGMGEGREPGIYALLGIGRVHHPGICTTYPPWVHQPASRPPDPTSAPLADMPGNRANPEGYITNS